MGGRFGEWGKSGNFAAAMLVIMGIMFGSILLGVVCRRKFSWIGKVTTVLVWLLLFLLGLEVGGNRQIVESLPTLGVDALVIALFATLGSITAAGLLWRWIK